MSWFDDEFYASRPRIARGGIKANTARGAFGKSWWAKRWISVLDRLNIGGRLSRGKSYARAGQVVNIEFQEGRVLALVQGSRVEPYKVMIEVAKLPPGKWTELTATTLSQASVAAKLLAGEMPENIEALFDLGKTSLFPTTSNDLMTHCSCPDWANPCKHVAAVYYLLGEEFDRDPFLIFLLRGMPKEKLVESIVSTESTEATKQSKKALKKRRVKPRTEALTSDPEIFWARLADLPGAKTTAQVPTIAASLPKRLGPLSFWRGERPLLETIEPIYKRASEHALSIVAGETE